MTSPYEILGVDPDADDEAVLAAYRSRIKEVHPDQGGSTEAFQAVKQAYERIQNGYEPEHAVEGNQPEQEPPEREPTPTVEYLNYEVLDDFGWSLSDEDLFEKAADARLDRDDYGSFEVGSNETMLEAAENSGFAWPFACRGGACTNCAVAIYEGEMPRPTGHILPPDLIDRGIRLSCLSGPITEHTKVVYNVKHMPEVQEFLLSASRFEKAYSTD